jgi:hypothetical protein
VPTWRAARVALYAILEAAGGEESSKLGPVRSDAYRATRALVRRLAHNRTMEREDAVRQLPIAYGIALRLRDAGVAEDTIAQSLDVDVHSVANILAVAESKLDALLGKPMTI